MNDPVTDEEAAAACKAVCLWTTRESLKDMRKALEGFIADRAQRQAGQKPVAWTLTLTATLDKRETTTKGYLWFSDPVNCCWTPLFVAPPPAAQPAREPLMMQDLWENPAVMTLNAGLDLSMSQLMQFVEVIEAAHGICQR